MNLLVTFLSARKNVFGGMERSIFSLIKGLEFQDCKVYVFTSNCGLVDQKFIQSEYLKTSFDEPTEYIDDNILRNYSTYKTEIRKEIICTIKHLHIDYLLVVDQLWGIIPHIDFWNNDVICRVGIVYHMFLQPELIQLTLDEPFNDYFAVSNDVRDKIIADCKTYNKEIHLLPNSYSEEEFYPNKKCNDLKYVFCNSRLARNKGIEFLLPAYVKFHKEYPDYKLILCGGKFHFGDQEYILNYIKRFVADNNEIRSDIIIIDNLDWEDIPKYVQNASMVVLPSGYESFGIAALESIACEVPLITTGVGNLPDLVGNAGIIVKYGDSQLLFEAMKQLMEDVEKKKYILSNCRLVKKKYESKRVAEEFLAIIENF